MGGSCYMTHVWRAEGSTFRNALINKTTDKRPRRKPRQRWKDTINEDVKIVDRTEKLKTAINCDKKRNLIEATKGLNVQ